MHAAAVETGTQVLQQLVAWPVEARDADPFGAAYNDLMLHGPVADDANVVVVPREALTHIASDAIGHLALPKVVAIHDVTDEAAKANGSGQVTLTADVVFVNDGGWSRPGMRLTADLEIKDGVVTWLVIDDGYVTEDAGLLP